MSKPASEVEEILREIRLRVQRENLERSQNARRVAETYSLDLAPTETSESLEPLETRESHDATVPAELAYLEARLRILDRTQNNLPPIVSRRNGLAARAELFVKRQIKRMTKWFVWDQLAFNTAVYESLLDWQKLQVSNAQEQTRLRESLISNAQEQAWLRESLVSNAQEQAKLRESSEMHKSETSAEIEVLREGLRQLTDEQTVIYKNILIQMSETAAVVEQSRRTFEERMVVLEKKRRSS